MRTPFILIMNDTTQRFNQLNRRKHIYGSTSRDQLNVIYFQILIYKRGNYLQRWNYSLILLHLRFSHLPHRKTSMKFGNDEGIESITYEKIEPAILRLLSFQHKRDAFRNRLSMRFRKNQNTSRVYLLWAFTEFMLSIFQLFQEYV